MSRPVSTEPSFGQGAEALQALIRAGLDHNLAQKLVQSPGNWLAHRVVLYINADGRSPMIEESKSQQQARQIMGRNYISLAEMAMVLKVSLGDRDLKALEKVPFDPKTLMECQDSHLLFPICTINLRGLREISGLLYPNDCIDEPRWFEDAYAREAVEVGWHLMSTDEAQLIDLTWDEQRRAVTDDQFTPSACEVAYMIILNFLVTGRRLLKEGYQSTRTCDSDEPGTHICVGRFGPQGLRVDMRVGDDAAGYPCLLISRKADL